jgi:uncharacterized membrane protein
MNNLDNKPNTSPTGGFDTNRPTIITLLYLSSFLIGLTGIVGVVLCYIWKGEPHEPWEETHYTYHINTFWFGLIGIIIGFILTIVVIGLFILLAVGIWTLVRTIIALVNAQKREAMPNPKTLLF